jgi:hypothetical protein
MKKFIQHGLMMAAGIFAVPAAVSQADQSVHSNECRSDDPRLESLRRFFRGVNSPLEKLASVFISEADAHNLDWRLLPGLSFVESTAGKSARGNNVFGWNNGKSTFASIGEGIHVVALTLSTSPMYKNKGLIDKLRTYNRNPLYVSSVQSAMRLISAGEMTDDE